MKIVMKRLSLVIISAILAVLLIACPQTGQETEKYSSVISSLESFVQNELDKGFVSGISVGLVDDQEVVWVKGFGFADKENQIPATEETVYRVGSISKLFTDTGIMQLVEQGKIDLDADIRTYFPEFRINKTFESDEPITLRQIMSHCSGLPRESPVGSYFDDTEPSLRETVESIFETTMIYPPLSRTKYSNIGVAMVGYILELVSGQEFVEYQRKNILEPLGMSSSDFLMTPALQENLSKSYMWVADGREITAPHFELGTIPAGNLYSTVEDMCRFIKYIFAGGELDGNRVLAEETLAKMFEIQFSTPEHPRRFGLGFVVGDFNGHRTVGHTGAVFGFTSIITALPDEKIGVVVLTNEDIAVAPIVRINNKALELMLEAKLGEKIEHEETTFDMEASHWRDCIGEYVSSIYWAEVIDDNGKPLLMLSGQPMAMKAAGEYQFVASNKMVVGADVSFQRDETGAVTGMRYGGIEFSRLDPNAIAEPPAHWQKYVGKYGKGFIPVIISIRDGRLYAFIENEYDYLLTPVTETLFDFPTVGMYQDQQLEFKLDENGDVKSIVMAFVEFEPLAD